MAVTNTVIVRVLRKPPMPPSFVVSRTEVGLLTHNLFASETLDKVRSEFCYFPKNLLKLLLKDESINNFAGYSTNHLSRTLVASGSRAINLGDCTRKIIDVLVNLNSLLELSFCLGFQSLYVVLVRNAVDSYVEHHWRRAVHTSATGIVIEGIHELNHGFGDTCIVALQYYRLSKILGISLRT